MRYVVFDLEWNQPLSHRSSQFQRFGKQLMFDLIQIGAVMLDDQLRMLGSFNQYIAPASYKKLHPRISRITGIYQADIADAPTFKEAYSRFLAWCGEDFHLITWGCDDISVLAQNLRFYMPDSQPLPPVYDLQRRFGALEERGKNRVGLQGAMQHFHIGVSAEHPFHSAVDDAYYTARVMQQMPQPEDIVNYPQQVREMSPAEEATKPDREGQYDDLRFSTMAQAILSRPAREPNCPVCGKRMKIPEGYVPMRDQSWRALADCPVHGLVMVDLIQIQDKNGNQRIRRLAALSEQQNPAYVQTKHLQWARKHAQILKKEA